MNRLGDQINYLLNKAGKKRIHLSKATGVPYTTLTQIINGRTQNPQILALEKVADYFGVSINYLLGKSTRAMIDRRLDERKMTLEQLSELTGVPLARLEALDLAVPQPWDYEAGGLIDKVAKALGLSQKELRSAFAHQEPPAYEGPSLTAEEAFAELQIDFENEEFETIAAHHEGEDWTEEELEEIERFKEYVKARRRQKGE